MHYELTIQWVILWERSPRVYFQRQPFIRVCHISCPQVSLILFAHVLRALCFKHQLPISSSSHRLTLAWPEVKPSKSKEDKWHTHDHSFNMYSSKLGIFLPPWRSKLLCFLWQMLMHWSFAVRYCSLLLSPEASGNCTRQSNRQNQTEMHFLWVLWACPVAALLMEFLLQRCWLSATAVIKLSSVFWPSWRVIFLPLEAISFRFCAAYI